METTSKLLEIWGGWVVNNENIINKIDPNNKRIIPNRIRLRRQNNDKIAIIINELMGKLIKNNKKDYDLLIDYYVFGNTFIQLAQQQRCSDTYIGKKLKKAEGIIEGMLILSCYNFVDL